MYNGESWRMLNYYFCYIYKYSMCLTYVYQTKNNDFWCGVVVYLHVFTLIDAHNTRASNAELQLRYRAALLHCPFISVVIVRLFISFPLGAKLYSC